MQQSIGQIQEQAMRSVERMPALNAVVLEVIRKSRDPNCSFSDLAEIISNDTSLTSRLLRISNSAYYGLPRRVETLSTAVALIGIQSLRRVVMAVSTFDILNLDLKGYGMEEGSLWIHSLGVATAAARLCRLTGYKQVEELRTAALLHDIGKIVLSDIVGEVAGEEELQTLHIGGCQAVDVERRVCGLDHAELSGMIAENWNLSGRFVELMKYHHRVEEVPNLVKGTAIVNVADTLASGLLGKERLPGRGFEFDKSTLEVLGLEESILVSQAFELNADILEEIAYWTTAVH